MIARQLTGSLMLLTALCLSWGALASSEPGTPMPAFKPSLQERANFAAMSPSSREAMMRAMVIRLNERLTAEPRDVEGWLRLGHARLALGERVAAAAAFGQAAELEPNAPGVLRPYASSLLGEGDPETGARRVTEEAAAVYHRLAAIVPDDPEPRWYLGLAAFQAGARAEAAMHWRAVLAMIEPNHPRYDDIALRLEDLPPPPRRSPHLDP